MHDRDRSIEGQAILKSILESPWVGKLIDEGTTIETLFKTCAGILDAYAKIVPGYSGGHTVATADVLTNAYISTGTKPQNDEHLTDEQVARGIAKEAQKAFAPPQGHYTAPNGKTYAFASEKQSKRAYAIQKGAGWQDYQVKALCQKYGFQNTKKIPVAVYNAFCDELQAGPKMNESSQHLEGEGFGEGYQYRPEKS